MLEKATELNINPVKIERIWPIIDAINLSDFQMKRKEISLIENDKVWSKQEKKSFVNMIEKGVDKNRTFEIQRFNNMGVHLDIVFTHVIKT